MSSDDRTTDAREANGDREIASAVLFADIAGSTRLYHSLGDAAAEAMVHACLTRLTHVAAHHGGHLVKTIGDEILCRFERPHAALEAACEMQTVLRAAPPGPLGPMRVRIGVHYGRVLLRGRDVFGDAVNVAARLRDIAKAEQVITTAETLQQAPDGLRTRARQVDRAALPGRGGEVDVFEMLWDPIANVTVLSPSGEPPSSEAAIALQYRSMRVRASPVSTIRLGRDPDCDVVIQSGLASRQHARIEFRRGKFVLVDASTNGTFVQVDGAREVYLRRESLPLTGSGRIGLGQSCAEAGDHLVLFACE